MCIDGIIILFHLGPKESIGRTSFGLVGDQEVSYWSKLHCRGMPLLLSIASTSPAAQKLKTQTEAKVFDTSSPKGEVHGSLEAGFRFRLSFYKAGLELVSS